MSFQPTNNLSAPTAHGHGDQKIYGVYVKNVLSQRVILSITEIGNNIKQVLEQTLHKNNGKGCIAEGFIKPNSIKVMSYSSGDIQHTHLITFHVIFECMICRPVEGMIIEGCSVKTITKAGIHAEVLTDDGIVPITVFIARDHHNTNKLFNSTKENDKINVRVIGVRYELYDAYICVIAELFSPKPQTGKRMAGGGEEDDVEE